MEKQAYAFDAFISHAVEDKIPIANELCYRLERAGARIWYCGRELNKGDSIKRTIKEGFRHSRYAIVLFSKNYLSKTRNSHELVRLMTNEDPEKRTILPVFYDVTSEDVLISDSKLSDRFANCTGNDLDDVIRNLLTEIKGVVPHTTENRDKRKENFLGKWLRSIILGMK